MVKPSRKNVLTLKSLENLNINDMADINDDFKQKYIDNCRLKLHDKVSNLKELNLDEYNLTSSEIKKFCDCSLNKLINENKNVNELSNDGINLEKCSKTVIKSIKSRKSKKRNSEKKSSGMKSSKKNNKKVHNKKVNKKSSKKVNKKSSKKVSSRTSSKKINKKSSKK